MTLEKSKVQKVLRYRWAVFGIMAFAYFFVYFHRVSTSVVSSDLQDTFGVGAASIALLSSAYFYAYTVMQLPSGILTDSWGPRRTVSLFTLVAAVGAILTGVATDFELVIVGRVMIGVGVAMVYIPIMKILATWYRKNEFASLSGILLAVGNIGALSAAGPLGILSEAIGWQQVFFILGVLSVVLAIVAYLIIRDRPAEMNLPTIQEIEAEEKGEPVPEAKAAEKIPMVKALKMTFGSGMNFWPLAIWFFFMYGSIMVYQGLWAGPFYKDVLGWDKTTYSTVLTFIGIGMIFGCPLAGILSDKVLKSRKKVLIVGTLIYTAVWGIIWLAGAQITSTVAWMGINFLFGFFGGFFVVSYAQIKELFPITIVGTTTAALNIFPFAGGAVLQQVSGLMLTTRTAEGYQLIWLFMFACMLIACVGAFLSREKTHVPETTATDVTKKGQASH
ncbi:MAG: MFS transporter [Methanomassiliicoccus sp.]|nr:MFS transporter [Methanomassiliicoccus sp.]